MIFLLIVIFIGVAFLELPGLIKRRYWRELKVFSLFLLIAFIMSLFHIIGIPLPNPVKEMDYLVKDILHLNYK
jgi:hypothetical protein